MVWGTTTCDPFCMWPRSTPVSSSIAGCYVGLNVVLMSERHKFQLNRNYARVVAPAFGTRTHPQPGRDLGSTWCRWFRTPGLEGCRNKSLRLDLAVKQNAAQTLVITPAILAVNSANLAAMTRRITRWRKSNHVSVKKKKQRRSCLSPKWVCWVQFHTKSWTILLDINKR